jgi:hypothetical protein
MNSLDSRCEKCEQDIKRLQIELDAFRSETIKVVGGVLARVDEILAKVDTCNRQVFAALQAQTEAGFASLRAHIDSLPPPLSERKKDEPPKLN